MHYIHNLDPFIFRITETFGLRWYGFSYLLGFIVGYFLYRCLVRKGFSDMNEKLAGDYIFTGALFGVIVGGRLGYMLFYSLGNFIANPLSFFYFHEGGMSAHGGIVGFMIFTWWFCRRHRLSWLNAMDNLAVVAPPGIFFGRLANFINGELYGRISNVPWAVKFPSELHSMSPHVQQEIVNALVAKNPAWDSVYVIHEAVQYSPELRTALAEHLAPRHPSQIYEALGEGALLFAVLWILRTRFRLHDGVLSGVFLMGYAVIRSACEFFREPDSPLVGLFTRGQFLSLFLFLAGVVFLVVARYSTAQGTKETQKT